MEKGRETDTIVAAVAPEAEGLNAQCAITGPLDPCTIVIFGATGDLTARKLIPALFKGLGKNKLPHLACLLARLRRCVNGLIQPV